MPISPLGTEIAFDDGALDRKGSTWVAPIAGGTPRRVVDYPGYDNNPRWSPHGLVLAIHWQGPDGIGPVRVFTIARDSVGAAWKDPVRLTDFACAFPVWPPEGGHLACDAAPTVALITRAGEVVARLTDGMEPGRALFSRDGRDIFFTGRAADGQAGVWSIPVSGGRPRLRVAFDDPAVDCCVDP